MKNPLTPAAIEPAIFRFVAQHLNHCDTAVPRYVIQRLGLSSCSSIGTTAHCGLWPVEQCPSIFSYLPPTLSIFSLPVREDLFLLPLSILSWVFPFFSSLPVLELRSFWASYPPPFSPGDLTSLSFVLVSILLYFLLCSSLLVLDSSDFCIPRFHIYYPVVKLIKNVLCLSSTFLISLTTG